MKREQRISKKMRKGDKVIAIAGNYRGLSGTVLSCHGEKVIVQGLNVRKRHMKGNRERKGEIVSMEKPLHISNLRVCTTEDEPIKLHVRTNAQGERNLVYKKDSKEVIYRSIKKLAK